MIEKIYRVVSSQKNLKSVSSEILGHDQPGIFIGWGRPFYPLNLFTSGLFCVKCSGDGGGFNHCI